MTIDEAIAHAREVAEKNRNFDVIPQKATPSSAFWNDCLNCAEECEQIAEWLEELKSLRKEFERASLVFAFNFKLSHSRLINDAMETTAQVLCKGCGYLDKTKCTYKGRHCSVIKPMLADVIKELEQLKERIE